MSEGIVELEGAEKAAAATEQENASSSEAEGEREGDAESRKLAKPKTRRQKRDKKKALFEKMKQNSKIKYKLKENDVYRIKYVTLYLFKGLLIVGSKYVLAALGTRYRRFWIIRLREYMTIVLKGFGISVLK
jgi:hypothetical protein